MDTAVTAKKKWWAGGYSPFNVSYGKLMMWYFLMSDAFTFGALLIAYGTIRFSSTSWPDPNSVFRSFPGMGETNMPLVFVSLMTFILIMSSVTMVLAVHAGHMRDRKAVAKWLTWTIVGGIAFLSCQAWEWTHLFHEGAWWGRNPFPNTDGTVASTNFTNFFFTITGFHGLHVTSGVILNIVILANVLKGTYEHRGHYEMVEKVGLYWHFVDLVWVFVFTCFYLL
ncbi:cytochrome c oxidase subunit 3 [Chitinophaga niastensis]|uniref:Cytochrome bo(3) ubiquinol oxidase subunit 3 n=1 Tax=Chitinophaga niastensis TaxID=536980 RepID=A0A2P8HTK7_CHINA|nr:cytochrome c oxidase subunit 3 [Chitinophaga niastensis]PSL49557.1 cytochrome c oxidase subunit 3 [Chitinophaga niastensis]